MEHHTTYEMAMLVIKRHDITRSLVNLINELDETTDEMAMLVKKQHDIARSSENLYNELDETTDEIATLKRKYATIEENNNKKSKKSLDERFQFILDEIASIREEDNDSRHDGDTEPMHSSHKTTKSCIVCKKEVPITSFTERNKKKKAKKNSKGL